MLHDNRKKCSSCDKNFAVTAFNRASRSPDGRATICRRCASVTRRLRVSMPKKSEIRSAIKVGNVEQVRSLLSSAPFSLNQLLHIAVQDYNTAGKRQGHEAIMELLISKGATPDWEMIFESARSGSQAIVDRLVAGGTKSNIFTCAAIGDFNRTKKLLQNDRSLALATTSEDVVHYQNFTALHFCCLSGLGRNAPSKNKSLLETGKILIDYEAVIEAEGRFYTSLVVTPLDMAAHTGGNLALIQLLIDKGANISSFAFANALAHRGRDLEQGFALAELFLQQGFEIDSQYKDGTVLHSFANSGAFTIVRWLLDHGADANARGRMGRSALHLAAERNTSSRTSELLVERGADLNARDDQGMTALDVAEHHGKAALARWLRRQRPGGVP